jgi:putative flippase GtrA
VKPFDGLAPETKRALRYGFVGIGNTVVGLSSYGILIYLGVNYAVAGAIAWILGTLHGYTWNRIWTFERADHRSGVLARYAAVGLVGAAMTSGLIALLVGPLGLPRFLAGVAALPFVVATTFALNRFWTFGRHIREVEGSREGDQVNVERL